MFPSNQANSAARLSICGLVQAIPRLEVRYSVSHTIETSGCKSKPSNNAETSTYVRQWAPSPWDVVGILRRVEEITIRDREIHVYKQSTVHAWVIKAVANFGRRGGYYKTPYGTLRIANV